MTWSLDFGNEEDLFDIVSFHGDSPVRSIVAYGAVFGRCVAVWHIPHLVMLRPNREQIVVLLCCR